jgi:Zn-dependent metalloprotease
VDAITFGTGGVDDAEDNEVIWHEYGHAIQDDQVPGFGEAEEAGAIGEGFGDYWAVTMSQATSPNTAVTPWPCVMDWDSTSYTDETPHCLRRTDGPKVYPGDLDGEVHDDGEIWSHALWDVNRALGRTAANRVILEAQFYFAPDVTMPTAAQLTVTTARALYGARAAAKTRTAFQQRGILS